MRARDLQWLIVGAGGMLATDLEQELTLRGARVRALPKEALDITDPASIARGIVSADVVVNCAAYTAVDAAEEHEDEAMAINGTGPLLLAQACMEAGIRLVHVSTDYVFAGDATAPYAEDDAPDPRSAYGRTKAEGERGVMAAGGSYLIVRTAWLYGAAGPCFPRTIAAAGAQRGALTVVDDQVGQPTWTRDVARTLIALVEAKAPAGIYHATSSGQASWFEFAREVCASAGLGDIVSPIPSTELSRPAPRPAWSVLGHEASEALGVPSIGHWRERWHAAAAEVLGLASHEPQGD